MNAASGFPQTKGKETLLTALYYQCAISSCRLPSHCFLAVFAVIRLPYYQCQMTSDSSEEHAGTVTQSRNGSRMEIFIVHGYTQLG